MAGDRLIMGLEGGKELDRALQAIGAAARKEALGEAADAGAEVILAAVHVPIGPGRRGKHLKDDLREKRLVTGKEHASVGIGFFGRTIAHLVEFGHQLVKGGRLGKGGRVVGHVPAHPFLRPAVDSTADQAAAAVGDTIAENIRDAVQA